MRSDAPHGAEPEPEPLAAEPTADGYYLHEPDGFPHRTMAVLAYLAFLTAAVFFAMATQTSVVFVALVFLVVPLIVLRIARMAHATRRREIETQSADPSLVPEHRDHLDVDARRDVEQVRTMHVS